MRTATGDGSTLDAGAAGDTQLLQLEHEGNRAVRLDDWKLVSFYSEPRGWTRHGVGSGSRTGAWELYNLSSDRTEDVDLAADEPQRLREMIEIYDEWAAHSAVVDWQEIQRRWGNLDDGDP